MSKYSLEHLFLFCRTFFKLLKLLIRKIKTSRKLYKKHCIGLTFCIPKWIKYVFSVYCCTVRRVDALVFCEQSVEYCKTIFLWIFLLKKINYWLENFVYFKIHQLRYYSTQLLWLIVHFQRKKIYIYFEYSNYLASKAET